MKASSLAQIKKELQNLSSEELYNLCAQLGRFKVENKLLLTYLLYYSEDNESYIEDVKELLDTMFEAMNTESYFYMKKTIRKVLRQIKLYSRISKSTIVEVELLLFFCERLSVLEPSIQRNKLLTNLYERQKAAILKKIATLHEDLQYDYKEQLKELPY